MSDRGIGILKALFASAPRERTPLEPPDGTRQRTRLARGTHAYTKILNVAFPLIRRVIPYCVIIAACSALAISFGKDLSWDQLNYHFYAGLTATRDRLTQDFFPASIQSYLNPFSFLPFYWLVRSELPPVLVGAALAALHSVNILIAYVATRRLISFSRTPSRWMEVVGVFLAVSGPVFLTALGTSFNDAVTSIPVVASFTLLLFAEKKKELAIFVGACLIGSAAALKLTNIIYIVGFMFGACLLKTSYRSKLTLICYSAGGCIVGYALVGGYWSYRLWHEFGNPFFPFFNKIFRSPDYLPVNIQHYRFLPENIADVLAFPFRMMLPEANIYTETSAPDVRFAVALILAFVLVATLSMGGRIGSLLRSNIGVQAPNMAARAFLGAIGVSFFLLVVTSGNGRYLMPVIVLIGPIIAYLICAISSLWRWRLYCSLLVLIAQGVAVALAADQRWTQVAWGDQWFPLELTEEFRNVPALYLTVRSQPAAFLAPFAHKNSSFANVIGQSTLGLDGPGGTRMASLLRKYRKQTWLLFQVSAFHPDLSPIIEDSKTMETQVASLGLIRTADDCSFLKFGALGGTRIYIHDKTSVSFVNDVPFNLFAVCPVAEAPIPIEFEKERNIFDRFFERFELACPELFQPFGTRSVKAGEAWRRFYVNTDITLVIRNSQIFMGSYGIPQVAISTISEVERGELIRCPPRTRSARAFK